MKLTSAIYTNEQLKQFAPYIDAAVLMVPHYALIYNNLDLDDSITFCHEKGITPILAITRIFMENELENLKNFISIYRNEMFMLSDLGLAQIFKDMGLIKNVIYDPTTLVCNSMDLNIYTQYGFNAVSMSNEIPLEDIKTAYRVTKAPIQYHVFGRKLMYYSKRKLISTYKDFRDINFESSDLSLVEEKRNYHIPIFENENGTYCFRHYNICLLNEIKNLDFLEYGYIETITIPNKDVEVILSAFKNALNNTSSVDDAIKEIEALNLPIEDGFAYQDTVHVKEKIVQCEK